MKNKIKSKIEILQSDIAKMQAEIVAIRNQCQHENLTGKFGADTGNWCPDDDSYWVSLKCEDCGKQWTEDQADTNYVYGSNVTKEGFRFRKI